MSKTLSSAAIAEFSNEVKHAYQGAGKLRDTVRLRTGIQASTYRFPKMGRGIAHERGAPSSDVVPMNISHTNATATLIDLEAPEYTDIFNQAAVNFEEKVELATTIAKALGRKEDQLIIDQVAAATFNTTATDGQGFEIAAGGTGFTFAKLLSIKKYYANLEIDEMPTILVDGNSLEDLLNEEKLTSSDYQNVQGLVAGTLESSTAMGCKFICIGSRRAEGGLGSNLAYSYVKSGVGHAVGTLDKIVQVDWTGHKSSWLSNGMLKAGSVVVDPEGLVKIHLA